MAHLAIYTILLEISVNMHFVLVEALFYSEIKSTFSFATSLIQAVDIQ